ncbi:MAG: glycosyltransferase family 2 protein [Lachnospiraceae bacterium]|nr:glycosyltransferase family 2 protein [Lachnospiraceae bacterium]
MNEVTVVIPNYNGIKYIADCLQALLNQEAGTPRFTVLVVDNGSADGSVEVMQERFPEVELVCLPQNTGFCHAVNVGIRQSQTPFVILLNNDTRVYPGFVKALYDAIGKDENVFSVSAQMLMWDRPELLDDAGDIYCVLGWARARGKGKPVERFDNPAEVFSACGGAAIYRKKVLEEIGLFDEQHFAYLEDLDIGYRARICGYHNRYEPGAKVLHYGSASTGSRYNAWKTQMAAANSVYVIWKNMPLLQFLWNFPFFLIGFIIKFLFFCGKRMGILYLKGLGQGLKRSFSREGRRAKVPFRIKNLRNYLRIQVELYANCNFINS